MIEFQIVGHFEYKGYTIIEVYAPLSGNLHGSIVPNEDGTFTAFIDPRDSYETQHNGLLHELDEHLDKQKAFDNIEMKDANKLEMGAHHIIPPVAEVIEEPAVTLDEVVEEPAMEVEQVPDELRITILHAYIKILEYRAWVDSMNDQIQQDIARMQEEEKKKKRGRRKSQKKIDEEMEAMGYDMNEVRMARYEQEWLNPER